eukprot:1818517-Prymnesium_polylepis.1
MACPLPNLACPPIPNVAGGADVLEPAAGLLAGGAQAARRRLPRDVRGMIGSHHFVLPQSAQSMSQTCACAHARGTSISFLGQAPPARALIWQVAHSRPLLLGQASLMRPALIWQVANRFPRPNMEGRPLLPPP